MTNPVSECRSDLLATDFFAPTAIQSLFLRPLFAPPSPVLSHVPFLFWLVGTVQPLRVAVLGAGDGVAHFALCQAMDKLNIPGRCLGFGFWAAPDDGDIREVPRALCEHAALLYDDLSELRALAEPVEALADLTPDSLDLLFVDLGAIPIGKSPQVDDLLAPLSKNGILVLHGSRDLSRRPDLGLSVAQRLFSEHQMEFSVGCGLTIAALGEDHPLRREMLLHACTAGTLPSDIEQVFRRLGEGMQSSVGWAEAKAIASQTQCNLSTLKKKKDFIETSLRDLTVAYETRSHKLSEAHTALFDMEAERRHCFEEITTLTRMLEEAREDVVTRAEAERRHRFEETAALTCLLEETRTEAARTETLERSLKEARTEVETQQARTMAEIQARKDAETRTEAERGAFSIKQDALRRELDNLRKESNALQAMNRGLAADRASALRKLDAILNSTSWRLTGILRAIVSALRRLRRSKI